MANSAIGLKTHIWNNNLRSLFLLGTYPFILLAILWGIGVATGFFMTAHGEQGDPFAIGNLWVYEYWPLLATIVALWFTVSWFFNTAMVRMMSHAHPVTREQEPELYNMLENLCISRGMKVPRLEIIETHARNAFASGVGDSSYTITLTRGLLNALRPDEVEGVMAHELTHIINRDVRLLMVCIIFTGMIGFAAQMMWSGLRHSIWVPKSSSSGHGKGGAFILYFAILFVLAIGYMASLLARFALSRSREYMADAGAVELTKNPEGMMRALLRISGRDQIPEATDDVALMCIENTKPFLGLFMTHPPIEARIAALSETTNTPVPDMSPRLPAGHEERFQKPGERAPEWLIRTRGSARNNNPWT